MGMGRIIGQWMPVTQMAGWEYWSVGVPLKRIVWQRSNKLSPNFQNSKFKTPGLKAPNYNIQITNKFQILNSNNQTSRHADLNVLSSRS